MARHWPPLTRDDAPALKAKSAARLAEATILDSEGRWCGAANRFYYSAFQALVAEFLSQNISPEQIFAKVGGKTPPNGEWKHDLVLRGAFMVRLDPGQRWLIGEAQAMRVKADYRPDPVEEADLVEIRSKLVEVLRDLGVKAPGGRP